MPRSIAIHWDQDVVRIATADVGDRVRVDDLVAFPISQSADVEAISETISNYAAKHGLARSDASVVIGRGQIELRVIELPSAPDEELPDLVRYQAKSHFSSIADGQPIDFIRLANGKDASPVYVLAATLSSAELKKIQTVFESTKLRVRHVLPRPFALVNLLRSELSAAKYCLLVNRFETEADLTVTYRNRIVLSRTLRLPHDQADQLQALILEIRRVIAAAPNQPSGGQVSKVIVLGGGTANQTLANLIDEQLKLPAEARSLEDFASLGSLAVKALGDDDGSFAPVLGCLDLPTEPSDHLIDFAIPHRRPEPVKDPRRKFRIAAIAGAAALLIFSIAFFMISQRRSELRQLEREFAELSADSAARDLLIGKVETIDKWKRGDVNWLDELYEISDRFPLPDEAIANKLTTSISATADEASLTVTGLVSEQRVENDMVNQLRDRPYKIAQGKTGPVNDHKIFTRNFDLRLGLPLSQRNVDQLLRVNSESKDASPPSTAPASIEPNPNPPTK